MAEQARTTPVSAVVGGISSGANYAKGLWDRLNGGGSRRMAAGSAGLDLPYPLPMPVDSRAKRTAAIAQLSRDIDALEQKLQEASKVCAAAGIPDWLGYLHHPCRELSITCCAASFPADFAMVTGMQSD